MLPLADPADPTGVDAPFGIADGSSKTGGVAGVYVQDEWRLTDKLTLNTGLRFDQMWQYVDANQFSPRANLIYKPNERHDVPRRLRALLHAAAAGDRGARQHRGLRRHHGGSGDVPAKPGAAGALALFRCRRGAKLNAKLQVSVDAYYKRAKNLLDDGQFGAALILSGFNYDHAENKGVEVGATYKEGNFNAYGNIAVARQVAKTITSNQYLFGADELAYIASNYVNTDHAQKITGSAGASYLWHDTRFSASMVYGSGLRSGFANTDHVAPYATANFGVSREITTPHAKPITAAFRHRQRLRQGLRDQGRVGHRRVRAAIRHAPRLLCRPVAEAMSGYLTRPYWVMTAKGA